MCLFIVGGDGLIGAALKEACKKRQIPCRATTRRREMDDDAVRLDLEESPATWQLPQATQVVVITAAMTALAACEAEPVRSRKINVEAPVHLAELAQAKGAAVIFLSTSLVFGGHSAAPEWQSPVEPETVYGRQKAEAERRIMQTGPRVAVLRITKVVHPALGIFRGWAQKLKEGQSVEPFSDMPFSPISVDYVIGALMRMATESPFEAGIFQLSGNRDVSYADAALLLADRLGIASAQVHPRSWRSSGVDLPFVPSHTTMKPRLPRNFDQDCLSVEETLGTVFDQLVS